MVLGKARALEGSGFPVNERRAFIFLYLGASPDIVLDEAVNFLSQNHWQDIECDRVALLDVEKLSVQGQAVQDAYMTAAKGKPSVVIFTSD